TRFAFVVALRDRWRDWKDERQRKRQQRDLERRRAERPMVTTQLVPARGTASRQETEREFSPPTPRHESVSTENRRTGIERMVEEEPAALAEMPPKELVPPPAEVEVTDRIDSRAKAKTTMPKISGSYKLPPSSLLHRPDEAQSVDEDELKLLAQVLTDKYAEFDVHGQVTQINP